MCAIFRKVHGTIGQERNESESAENADVQEKEIAPATALLRKSAAVPSEYDGGGLQEEFAPPFLSSSIIFESGTISMLANNTNSVDLPMSKKLFWIFICSLLQH